MHYEQQWLITFEVIAESEQEANKKVKAFKQSLSKQFGVTEDVWLIDIKEPRG